VGKIKILIFGKGYLGHKYHEYFNGSILSDKHINTKEDVIEVIEIHKPDIVINCIGITGRPNIDWCESHKEQTIFGNVIVPFLIYDAISEYNSNNNKIRMVHLSSGCIYEGDNDGKGFSEDDEPNFKGSFYSKTKALAEKVLQDFDVLILRIRMPIDSKPDERNLITKLLGYDKIVNVPNSVTIVDDLLKATEKLIENEEVGIFNITNPGLEYHDTLLKTYNEYSKTKKKYEVINLDELSYHIKAGRSNCILSTEKLKNSGVVLNKIEDSLKQIVKEYTKYEAKK
jgi:dTDP-4-dehydrorhamnose reductase